MKDRFPALAATDKPEAPPPADDAAGNPPTVGSSQVDKPQVPPPANDASAGTATTGVAAADAPATAPSFAPASAKNPLLVALGERLRELRARRGLTRKALAAAAAVSERHLANLEYGIGNASVLVLQQVATALHAPLAELLGDVTTSSPEWLLIRELLADRSEAELRRARLRLSEVMATTGADPARRSRFALVGLRGAGKTSLGQRLAVSLDLPFVELGREIEKLAGCSIREIYDLYGTNAYRRYERRALDMTVQAFGEVVIATPGGIVSEPATFNQLLAHCTTIWLRASPEEHMGRVAAQGDLRPMAASTEAMDDLKRILAGRAGFYSKSDMTLDTGRQSLDASFGRLQALVCDWLATH